MLVRGGTVVTGGGELRADVRIEGEQILEVAGGLEPAPEETTLEARGLYVLPGVVDPHTHFSLDAGDGRSADDFRSGTASAAAGGVTSFLNFATQRPGRDFRETILAAQAEAAGNCHVDYGFHLNVTRLDPGWEEDLDEVVAEGVSSAKVYTTYRGTVFYVDDWTIYRLMERSGPTGLLVQMHAENDDMLRGRTRELVESGHTSIAYHGDSRPPEAESEAVARGIFMARATRSPIYMVHLSSPLSVDLVAEARAAGVVAVAETCPHFLCLDDRRYAGRDAVRFLMTPPLRSPDLQEQLWRRLLSGRIDAVGSDHCGYSLAQRGAPTDFTSIASPGIPGTETELPLMYTYAVRRRGLPLVSMVRLLAENPARIFGLWPRKGAVQAGADADLVLFDPSAGGPLQAGELHSAAAYSPFEGLELDGRVRTTICRGRVVYDRGRVVGDPGWGGYLHRARFDAARLA